MPPPRLALPLLVALGLSTGARAESPWGLTWNAPEGCIQPGELAQRAEERLGKTVFGQAPARHIEGSLRPGTAPSRWRAKLTLTDSTGTVLGSREVTSAEASCRSIDEPLLLVLVLMIDPEAALRRGRPAEPSAAAPAPAPTPEDPPLPEVDEAALARARALKRLRVEEGRIYEGYRTIELEDFYLLLDRADLLDSLSRRRTTRVVTLVGGTGAVAAGGLMLVGYAIGAGCVRYAGSPSSPGACVEGSPVLLASGVVLLAAGAAAIATGVVRSPHPTTDAENATLADEYNTRYRLGATRAAEEGPSLGLSLGPTGGGLALSGRF